jgi:hypothetical protein
LLSKNACSRIWIAVSKSVRWVHMGESSLPELLTWRLLAAARGESPPLHASRPRKKYVFLALWSLTSWSSRQRPKPWGHAKTLADAILRLLPSMKPLSQSFRLAVADNMRPNVIDTPCRSIGNHASHHLLASSSLLETSQQVDVVCQDRW